MYSLARAGHYQGAGVRYFNIGVVLSSGLGNFAQDGDTGDRLNVVHVLNAWDEQDRPTHFSGTTNGFVNSIKTSDFANNDRVTCARPQDGAEHCHYHHYQRDDQHTLAGHEPGHCCGTLRAGFLRQKEDGGH